MLCPITNSSKHAQNNGNGMITFPLFNTSITLIGVANYNYELFFQFFQTFHMTSHDIITFIIIMKKKILKKILLCLLKNILNYIIL
jgi:hypothetical protein